MGRKGIGWLEDFIKQTEERFGVSFVNTEQNPIMLGLGLVYRDCLLLMSSHPLDILPV